MPPTSQPGRKDGRRQPLLSPNILAPHAGFRYFTGNFKPSFGGAELRLPHQYRLCEKARSRGSQIHFLEPEWKR
jgi:hypothetical protein